MVYALQLPALHGQHTEFSLLEAILRFNYYFCLLSSLDEKNEIAGMFTNLEKPSFCYN
jgi:hypothetical protein